MKIFLVVTFLSAILIAFGGGLHVGATRGSVARETQLRMGLRVCAEVRSIFGVLGDDSAAEDQVVGRIHLSKDVDLAVVQDGEVKTIRAWSHCE